MKNENILYLFLTITCSLFFSAIPVHAKPLKGFYSACLDAKMYGGGKSDKSATTPQTAHGNKEEEAETGAPHAAELLIIPAKRPKWPNSTVYVFMCSGRQGVCGAVSTDPAIDINLLLFGTSGQRGNEEQAAIAGRGNIRAPGTNPNMTDAEALHFVNAPLVWSHYSAAAIPHSWSWVQPIDPPKAGETVIPEELSTDERIVLNGDEFEAGNDQGLKIGQISMENETTPSGTPTSSGTGGTGTKCANIQWDPRGYVFDAKTLHPVQNTTLTLYAKNGDGSYTQVPNGIGTTNPYTTATNSGQFNFFVQPGLYKMTVDSLHATIAEKQAINPAYQHLFMDEESKVHIYEKGADIEEVAGRVAVAHIPVHVANSSYIIDSLHLIMEDAVVNMDNQGKKSQMHITGTVSHPRSQITVTLTALNELGSVVTPPPLYKTTNEFGEYDFYIDQEQMQADGKPLYLQNIHISIEMNAFYTSQPSAKKAPISYDLKPLPRYVEGIAYDEKGVPIPNAIVALYPYFSLNPMYTTLANKDGRFKIGSDHIPQMNYKLRYKKQNGDIVEVSPDQFIRQNISYYATKTIDPFTERFLSAREEDALWILVDKVVTDDDMTTLSRQQAKKQHMIPITRTKGTITPEEEGSKQKNSPFDFSLVITIFIIIGLIGVAGLIGSQLMQKKNTPLQ